MERRTAARRNTAIFSRLLTSLKVIEARRSMTESSRSKDFAEIDCRRILVLLPEVMERSAFTKSPASLRRSGAAISFSISRAS